MKVSLGSIQHDQSGFEEIASLYARAKNCSFEDIEIDMGKTTWISADMCAAFGAVLSRMENKINTVSLINVRGDKVHDILSRNGFLSHHGRDRIPDLYGTTIAYKRFNVEDSRNFAYYIEHDFLNRPQIPRMSPRLLKKFGNSLCEIFSNAVVHSRTDAIFSCGQFFPKDESLTFTVADSGTGIKENIRTHWDHDLPPEKAIDWATRVNNTAKRGEEPGGLGLNLLCRFIDLNGGDLQIASDAGYWRRSKEIIAARPLRHPFPGTVVSLKINTADESSYALSSATVP